MPTWGEFLTVLAMTAVGLTVICLLALMVSVTWGMIKGPSK